MSSATLVDEIYEAGVLPEKWPKVLNRLAEIGDTEGILQSTFAPGRRCWLASPAIHDIVVAWATSPWLLKDPRRQRPVPSKETRCLAGASDA
jgi:hypothetical protein